MFEEVVCPRCKGNLIKKRGFCFCRECHESYPFKGNFISLWKNKFEKDNKSQHYIEKELRFTSELAKTLRDKDNKNFDKLSQAEEFLIRDRKTSYAAVKLDEKGLNDLKVLLPSDISDLKILDIGAGFGKEAEYLKKWGAKDLVLMDLSLDLLKEAKKRVKARYFFQANAENLPLKSDSFDLAIFGSTLHHLSNPLKALKDACRVAKMVAAFNEPSSMYKFNLILKKIGWNTEYGNLKTHRFNPERIKNYFQRMDYQTIIKTDFIWFPVKQLKFLANCRTLVDGYYLFLGILDKVAGHWGHNLTFIAKKHV